MRPRVVNVDNFPRYTPAPDRYDHMPYARSGASGLKLPRVSLGLWHNFGDDADRRMVNVHICPAGVARLQEIRVKMRELVGEWATSLSITDLRNLNQSLTTITQVLGSTLQQNKG